VHYLHGRDLDERTMALFSEMVERGGGAISFLSFDDDAVAALPPMPQSSPATWYRVLLPDLLPDVERVLYLDVDTIVVDSLEPLWETDLSGKLVGAVTNVLPPGTLDHPAEIGLSGPEAYFNAGVLLVNLGEIRRRGMVSELREFSLAHGHDLLWRDQDVLNILLGRARVSLHPRWNWMNAMVTFEWATDVFGAEVLEEARRRPGIRHFEGPLASKPWHYLCEQGQRDSYFEHRRQTPWPDCEIVGATPRAKAKQVARRVLRVEPARWETARQAPPPLWKRIGRG
jgi:lipopolysaccharide biosynthesis glycosyltransferase